MVAQTHGRELLHPVESIHGIGAKLATELGRYHMATIEELLALATGNSGPFGEMINGITPTQLRDNLLPQARLLMLPGVSEKLAGELVTLGYRRYTDLVAAPTATLHTQLSDRFGTSTPPTTLELGQIQLSAARAAMTGVLLLRIVDAGDLKPIATAQLHLRSPGLLPGSSAVTRRADVTGLIVTPRLRSSVRHTCVIEAPGYRPQTLTLQVRPGQVRLTFTQLVATESSSDSSDMAVTGVQSGRVAFRVEQTELRLLPEGTTARVVATDAQARVSLVSLDRRRVGNVITAPAARIDVGALPPQTQVGDYVRVGAAHTLERLSASAVEQFFITRDGIEPTDTGRQP